MCHYGNSACRDMSDTTHECPVATPATGASSTDLLTMLETQEQELVAVHEEYCELLERTPDGWNRVLLRRYRELVAERLQVVRATIRGLRAAARLEVA